MLFSVIIPAFNAEQYIEDCLSSVVDQTCHDYEVVIVDDGSSDLTSTLADEYAKNKRNATVLHGPNQGPLLARRRGLRHAKGEYVIFLDADDCLRSDALEVIASAIDDTDADIVAFHHSRDTDFSAKNSSTDWLPSGLYTGERFNLIKEHVCKGRFNNLWGKAIRLCRIDTEAIYGEYKGLMHGEDLFQLLPIIDSCDSLMQLDDILYCYRPNNSSSTARYKTSQLADIVKVNRRLREYAHRWGGRCATAACTGENNQYMYLLKISELSKASKSERAKAFAQIRTTMFTEGTFDRTPDANLRIDNRVLTRLVKSGLHSPARLLIQAVEIAKLCKSKSNV